MRPLMEQQVEERTVGGDQERSKKVFAEKDGGKCFGASSNTRGDNSALPNSRGLLFPFYLFFI